MTDEQGYKIIQDWLTKHKITEVECLVPDVTGIPRGKILPVSKFAAGLKPTGGLRLPEQVFGQTVTGDTMDSVVLDEAIGDILLYPDPAACYLVPWYKEPTAQIIHDAVYPDGREVGVAPRSVLKRVLRKFEERGLRAVVAPELEFFLVAQNSDPDAPLKTPLGRSGRAQTAKQAYGIDAVNEFDPFFEDVYDHCAAMGLDIDTLTHEEGASQMEINFNHGDALTLADQALLFKRTVRQTALNHDIHATFMAKPMQGQPGSSMHLHCSIKDVKTGKNIFAGPDGKESDAFRWALAGLQTHLAGGMPLMAPFMNSYRRFATTYEAAANLDWAYDDRTVGLRVPVGDAMNRRIENRIPGADTNPYLVIALTLACIYLGLEAKVEPTAPAQPKHKHRVSLPRNLDAAIDKMDKAKSLRSILGEDFLTVFSEVKRAEADEFLEVISSWEREFLLLNV